jgi:putative ABC transport system permease protein
MSKFKLTLKAGRLPEAGTREIAIHYLLARNKNLKIGDKIGSNLDKEEIIQGERTIVGLIEGKSIVSFDSLETWLKDNQVDFEYMLGMVILPKDGYAQQLNRQLESLNLPGLEVRTFNTVNSQYTRDSESIKIILTFISILVIVIVSFCTGFLCFIYFSQRRSEFGLLNAIGYSKQQVINRAFGEISGLNIFGFVAGISLSLLVGVLIDFISYAPRGQILEVWDLNNIMKAACIPIFVTLFSIVPIWRMLKKLDPITIIEGGQQS